MLMLSSSHAAIADDLEDGVAAYVKQDFATALRLWTPLAEQGNVEAELQLGQMYDLGRGVAEDAKTAVKWYTLAAEKGDKYAQNNLGKKYERGQGVAQNYKIAVKWYTLSAEQGNDVAQWNLASMLEKGQGVAQDYVKAHMWLNIAASNILYLLSFRDDLAKKMTPAQIVQAQEAASRCIKQNFKNCE